MFGRRRGFEPYIRDRNVEGAHFRMRIADADAREWYDTGTADPHWPEMRFIRDHLVRPGTVIFDCGAHQGSTAMALARMTGPAGRVVAFEPVGYNCDRIEENLALSGITNVVVERRAVGRQRGRAGLQGGTNAWLAPLRLLRGRTRVVPLDDYAHLEPSLLKIDVEGSEFEALAGARRILATRPALAIEIHSAALAARGVTPADLMALIGDGYEMWLQPDPAMEPRPTRQVDFTSPNPHLFCVPK